MIYEFTEDQFMEALDPSVNEKFDLVAFVCDSCAKLINSGDYNPYVDSDGNPIPSDRILEIIVPECNCNICSKYGYTSKVLN